MPQAAVATGCVDFVLPPEGIAAEIVRIGRHPYIALTPQTQPDQTPAGDEEKFDGILALLRAATGIDFSRYGQKIVRRRILRRLALRRIDGLAEYGERLENDAGEVTALQRDLLISVTSFFRDREAFESLKKNVFPSILQARLRQRYRFASGWRDAPREKKPTPSRYRYRNSSTMRAPPFRSRSSLPTSASRRLKRPAPAGTPRTSRRTLHRSASTAISPRSKAATRSIKTCARCASLPGIT